VIEVRVQEPVQSTSKPEGIPLDIVYEDEDLLVVNKPPGMVVHPAPGNYSGTLVNALLHHCKNLSGIGGVLRPGIVHRIDKGTSGLLVVAKNDGAHKGLAKQFKERSIARTYIALVRGALELDRGTIELPIGRSRRDRKKMGVAFLKSKNAVTGYRVLRRFADATEVELKLSTGRTHQIRVHMAYIGHPISGDEKYGTRSALGRPALHAKTIGFIHPKTGIYMQFDSDIPRDMLDFMKNLQ
jgi:23S rRNA pseudouridine1911/1915/1917 synthase